MYKLLGILAVSALLAVAYAEEANIISDTKIVIDGKKVPFRGDKNHIALHVNVQKDLLINNIVELVQAVYSACVAKDSKKTISRRELCRNKIRNVVNNGLNIVFDVIELSNHMLVKGVNLGHPNSVKNLQAIAALLAPESQLKKKKPRRQH